jgi:hypothetical protein
MNTEEPLTVIESYHLTLREFIKKDKTNIGNMPQLICNS